MVLGRRRAPSKVVTWAKGSFCFGGHSAEEIDGINTLHGIVSALSLSFVLGLQYMLGPGDSVDFADFRSLICKNERFREYIHELLTFYDVGTHEYETFNFTQLVGPRTTFDVEHYLLREIPARYGNSKGQGNHFKCISDVDVQTVATLTYDDIPQRYLKAFMLQQGDLGGEFPRVYRFSRITEQFSCGATAMIFSGLLWSIMLNLSLALAPVREDQTGQALSAWLLFGLPTMVLNYGMLLFGLVLFFVTHGRVLLAASSYVHATNEAVVTISFYGVTIPVVVFGGLLGIAAGVYSTRNAGNADALEDEPKPPGEDGQADRTGL